MADERKTREKDGSAFPDVNAFEDPLENFESKTYDDPMEAALAELTVAEIQHTPFVVISDQTTVADAIRELERRQVSCVLVEENDALVGVFGERDVLDKVALEYDQVCDRPVRDVMTPNPVFVYKADSAAAALTVMAVSGYRHVPILNYDDKIVGIVSPQRVTAFLMAQLNTR